MVTRARALRLFLAAALLAAWQGALVHPLEHLDVHGGLVHLDGKDGRDGRDGKRGNDAQCDALAAVAACVDGRIPLAVPHPAAAAVAVAAPAAVLRGVPPPAYRSQAPPQYS